MLTGSMQMLTDVKSLYLRSFTSLVERQLSSIGLYCPQFWRKKKKQMKLLSIMWKILFALTLFAEHWTRREKKKKMVGNVGQLQYYENELKQFK